MLATVTRFRQVGIFLKQSELDAAPAIRANQLQKVWPENNNFHCPIRAASLQLEALFFASLEIHADGDRHQEVARTWMVVFA